METQSPEPQPIVHDGTLFSPSPDAGVPLPTRRKEDTKSYAGEWTILIVALLGWATTFCLDMATEESFSQILTPQFIGLHIGQLFTVMTSVIAAKRLK